MSDATAGSTPAACEAAADGQPATPEAGKAPETPAARKIRLKGLDGDSDQEYDESHLVGLAKRGKNAAQLASLAEKKAQEALKREQETEKKLARLKDPKQVRAALKDLGVDVRGLSTEEILEAVEEEKLSPEQRRIRDLEREKAAREETDAKAKSEAEHAQQEEETARHLDEIAHTFQEVMVLAGLPRESASAVGYRLVPLYQAAHAAGVSVDPELAAERVKAALKAEHKAMFTKKDGSLDTGALKEWVGPHGMEQLRKEAVKDYLAQRNGGQAPAPTQAAPQSAPQPRNGKQEPRRGSSEWWRQQTGG